MAGDSPVEKYFKHRHLDPADLDEIPETKQVFDGLGDNDFDVLDRIGKALDDDFSHGKHVGKKGGEAVTPEEKLQTFIYAIH